MTKEGLPGSEKTSAVWHEGYGFSPEEIKLVERISEVLKPVELDYGQGHRHMEASEQDALQQTLLSLQGKKEGYFSTLERRLEALNEPNNPAHGRGATVTSENGSYYMFGKKGVKEKVALGDVMTGGMWGHQYRFDETVDLGVHRQYLLTETLRAIHELCDQQIALAEAESWYNDRTGKDVAYRALARRGLNQVENLESQEPGIVAERIVLSFMTRVAVDHRLPFEIVQASVRADVEYKIDFIIHVNENAQGVHVGASEGSDIGIQLTTRQDQEGLEGKQAQVDRAVKDITYMAQGSERKVESIVLVSVPIQRIRTLVSEWKSAPRKVGGVDSHLSTADQEKIFRGVLQGIFTEDAIGEMWKEIIHPPTI